MGGRTRNEAGKDALIISQSPVNRIVITRSLERLLLKAEAVAPDQALFALEQNKPWLVVIDEQGSEEQLETFTKKVMQQRRGSENKRSPLAMLIARSNDSKEQASQIFDAVLVRPVTPDVLLPTVERLTRLV